MRMNIGRYFSVVLFVLSISGGPVLAQTEAQVAAQISLAGGFVFKNGEGKVHRITLVSLSDFGFSRIDYGPLTELRSISVGGKVSDRSMRQLQTAPATITKLQVTSKYVSDEGLIPFLRRQKSLQDVTLMGTSISDETLTEIAKLEELWNLNLGKTKVTDAGIKKLAALPLSVLHLYNTDISNDAIKEISKMTTLSFLTLDGTNIDDAAIPDLLELDNLRILGVKATKITNDGRSKIKAGLPKVKFVEDIAPAK